MKTTELCELLDELAKCGKAIISAIDGLVGAVDKVRAVLREDDKKYTFTQVRATLAHLAASGHKDEVKKLLESYGAEKLSDLKEEDYAAVIREAEVIENE